MFWAYLTLLLLLPEAFSQNPSLEVEAIQAHFKQSLLVPSLLAQFNPSAIATLNYPGVGDVQPGQPLTKQQVGSAPAILVNPVNSTVSLAGNYTLVMVDAGPVGTDESQGVTRHWLVNGVTIANSRVSNNTAVAITQYAGPAPPAGSGPHRYVIILYAQPSTFTPPVEFSQPNIGVSVFDLNAYVRDSRLGDLVAANYITVEEGQASLSISATSPVITSTLPVGSRSLTTSAAAATQTRQGNSATKLRASWNILILVGFIVTLL